MRSAEVYYKDERAGLLIQHNNGSFTFSYSQEWLSDSRKRHISLTLPKTKKDYHSAFLFPFFYNMLPEGSNKTVVCTTNKIDEADDFGILLATANSDNIGAVTVQLIEQS